MEKERKYQLLAEALDVDVKAISPERELNGMDEWDSLGKLAVIAMLSANFGRTFSMETLRGFGTMQDILSGME